VRVVVVVMVALALSSPTAAFAPPGDGIGGGTESLGGSTDIDAGSTHGGQVTVIVTETGGHQTGSPGGNGGTTQAVERWIRAPVGLGTNPDTGRACVEYRWMPESEYVATDDLTLAQAYLILPDCPVEEGPDPEEAAHAEVVQYLRTVQLPVPLPTIPPGRALTGLAAHLDAGTDLATTIEADLGAGHLVLDATSTIVVDWGDGVVDGPLETTGGPWPAGDIVHVYPTVGTVDVTVTQTWSVVWAYGGFTGTIATLDGAPIETTATVVLPVDQVQAVVH
jgi:hypothetical protein